jgi:hypothetical protein
MVNLFPSSTDYAPRLKEEGERGNGGISSSFSTSALDGGEWSATHSCSFRDEKPRFSLDTRLGGPHNGMDAVEKSKNSFPLHRMERRPTSP